EHGAAHNANCLGKPRLRRRSERLHSTQNPPITTPMPQQNLRRSGHGRRPPTASNVVLHRASGIAMAALLLGLQLLAGGARANVQSGSMPAEAPSALQVAASFKPADEFERLPLLGRAQPQLATAGL